MLKLNFKYFKRVSTRLLSTTTTTTQSINLSPSLTHEFTLYGYIHSQPVRSVLLLLDEFKLDYKFISLNPISKETRSPDYLKINPTGLIPCLIHDNISIGEGSAIMQYICNTKRENPSISDLYPSPVTKESTQKRAKIDFWLSWHHHNTRNCTYKLLHPYVFRKLYVNHGGYEKTFNPGLKSTKKSFQFLEKHFYENKTICLTGNTISIADYMLLPEIDQLLSFAYNILPTFEEEYPSIMQWYKNCSTGIGVYESNFKEVAIAGQAYQQILIKKAQAQVETEK